MGLRRIRVDGADSLAVWSIAAVAAVGVVLAAPAPTGSRPVDVLLIVPAVCAVVWASASAPWWAGAVAATLGGALAPSLGGLLVAVLAFGAAGVVGVGRRPVPWARALSAGLALQALVRLGDRWFVGGTALVGVATSAALAIAGLTRRSRRHRRRALCLSGVVLVAGLAALGAFALAARGVRDGLEDGADAVRAGLDLLADGEIDQARERFEDAASAFDDVRATLDGVAAQPARALPVVAQHRAAVIQLAGEAAEALRTIDTVLDGTDLDAVRLVNGRIDLVEVHRLAASLASVTGAMDAVRDTVDAVDSQWLVAPVRDRLASLREDLAEQRARGERVSRVLALLPRMLGEGGSRRYFVALTTPAEARGLGGFMGNWIEIELRDGEVEVTDFGRTRDLNFGGDTDSRRVHGSVGWLARYGRFDFDNGPGGTTGIVPWSNITVSPDFPSTATVIADLYPQSGGRAVDGVVVLDVEAIAGLLQLTGPITVTGRDDPISASSAVDLLLRQQYEDTDQDARKDVLEQIALAAIEQVLGGEMPGPSVLADVLGPLVEADRISIWSADAEEQAMLVDMGFAGELPTLAGGDGVAVTVNNRAANKIDVYLDRSFRYEATVDRGTGQVQATVTLTLTNDAPSDGLPDAVIGNQVNEPAGTNQMYLSLFTPLRAVSAEVDGETIGLETSQELEWWVHSLILDVPPGDQRVVIIHLRGVIDAVEPYRLQLRPQPLVADERWTIDVVDESGVPLVQSDQVVTTPVAFISQ